ncbi:MAG: AI-2E family transporter [Patescibacteria group bacterium]
MQERKLEVYLYFILLAAALYVMFKIFEPYLFAIIIAAVFAVVFYPLHKRVRRSIPNHPGLAAFFTLAIVTVIIVIPIILYGIQLSDEVKNFYGYTFNSMQGTGFLGGLTQSINNIISSFSPFGVHWPTFDIAETETYFFQTMVWVRDHFGDIFSGLTKFFFNALIFLFSLFYFLKDGDAIRKKIIEISPFPRDQDEFIFERLRMAVMSVVKGSMVVAIVQGFMTGLGFYIFGVPSALLWGGVTVIAALVPAVGTALVIVPGVLYLFFIGSTTNAIGMAIWGAIAINLIDNTLSPRLIGRGIKIHPLLVLLSALGGIGFFGPVGFIIGPIALSFLFTLFDIYKTVIVGAAAK